MVSLPDTSLVKVAICDTI